MDNRFSPQEVEGIATSSFRFYDATGLRWQARAPDDQVFWDQQENTERLISNNGQRVALITAGDGGIQPTVQVIDANGSVLYALPTGEFTDFFIE